MVPNRTQPEIALRVSFHLFFEGIDHCQYFIGCLHAHYSVAMRSL